jgi:hypothetical protein
VHRTVSTFLISTAQLLKNVVVAPNPVFGKIRDGWLVQEVVAVFTFALLITLLKAWFKSSNSPPAANFFVSESLNQALSFLAHPLLGVIFFCLAYCAFLLGVSAMCRTLERHVSIKSLTISLMAISAVGVIMHLAFYPLSLLLPTSLLLLGEYLVYVWILVLSILAIKTVQHFSAWKAIVSFLVPFFFVVLSAGHLSVAPYIGYLKG